MPETRYRKQEIPDLFFKRLEYSGQLLREYRRGIGMSRQQVEEEWGISRRTVEQIETGRPISVISLYRYASCFGLEPSDKRIFANKIKRNAAFKR